MAPPDRRTHIFKTRPGVCQKFKKNTLEKEKKSFPSVPYLNADIMWHIFNRVPATSLFDNCRFLCKQWSNLICNHNFVKAHFLQSRPGIVLVEYLEIQGTQVQVLKFVEFKEPETGIGKVHNLHTFNAGDCIKSICAGLFLISDISGNWRIMNPVTKESMHFPRPVEMCPWRQIIFDRANMNYMIADTSHEYISQNSMFSIINLRGLDGTCKRIEGAENYCLKTPVLINGVLYYPAREKGLWCFDLSSDTFWVVTWPINVDRWACIPILDVGGYVGFVAIDVEINIWILRERKWVLKCCIGEDQPLPGKPLSPQFVGCLSDDLFVFSKNGRKSEAYAYNIKTKQWIMLVEHSDNIFCCGTQVSSILPLSSKTIS